jgi:hypothetical protein
MDKLDGFIKEVIAKININSKNQPVKQENREMEMGHPMVGIRPAPHTFGQGMGQLPMQQGRFPMPQQQYMGRGQIPQPHNFYHPGGPQQGIRPPSQPLPQFPMQPMYQ